MKLTDTQLVVLSTAAARDDGSILPLPDHVKGGAVAKVCNALVGKGLVINAGGNSASRLILSHAGRRALGLDTEVVTAVELDEGPKTQLSGAGPKPQRADTKQAQLIAMLKTPDGASVEEIVTAFNWQAHTVRGAIAGALKKKLGLDIQSEAVEGRGRVYRILG